jgi:hypothetical protein
MLSGADGIVPGDSLYPVGMHWSRWRRGPELGMNKPLCTCLTELDLAILHVNTNHVLPSALHFIIGHDPDFFFFEQGAAPKGLEALY